MRIVQHWNDLPECVVGAGNLACSKCSVGSFLNMSRYFPFILIGFISKYKFECKSLTLHC